MKKPWEDRLYGINSEGDLYEEGTDRTVHTSDHPKITEMIKLWNRFMGHFRNWENNRKPGGAFSDTMIVSAEGKRESLGCVMPCGYVAKSDEVPRAWLQLEYAAKDNSRITKESGPMVRELKPRLDILSEELQKMYPDLSIFLNDEGKGYYMLNLCGTAEQADELYEAVVCAVDLAHSDEVIFSAHEWIG